MPKPHTGSIAASRDVGQHTLPTTTTQYDHNGHTNNHYNPMASPVHAHPHLHALANAVYPKRHSQQSMSSKTSAQTVSTSRSSFDRGSHHSTEASSLASFQIPPPSGENHGAAMRHTSVDGSSRNQYKQEISIEDALPSRARRSISENVHRTPSSLTATVQRSPSMSSSDHEVSTIKYKHPSYPLFFFAHHFKIHFFFLCTTPFLHKCF